MRAQCPDGHWFTFPGPCPYNDCGYKPEDIPPPPPARRDVEDQVTRIDRDALAVAPPEREQSHREGFAAARRALAEAAWRKQNASKLEAVK